MVNNLPASQEFPTMESNPTRTLSPSQPVVPNPGNQIAQEEIINLLTNGSSEEIRAALPRMSPEWQQFAQNGLSNPGK